jgi:hypothetical protein
MAEGKELALAIGVLKMPSDDMYVACSSFCAEPNIMENTALHVRHSINKGIGIECVHTLNDGLWHLQINAS